jgi:hypothetical protein
VAPRHLTRRAPLDGARPGPDRPGRIGECPNFRPFSPAVARETCPGTETRRTGRGRLPMDGAPEARPGAAPEA